MIKAVNSTDGTTVILTKSEQTEELSGGLFPTDELRRD